MEWTRPEVADAERAMSRVPVVVAILPILARGGVASAEDAQKAAPGTRVLADALPSWSCPASTRWETGSACAPGSKTAA
jgi:hypothetical protein